MNPRRFTVALSFPGEHRDFVSRVADCLAEKFTKPRVLYDKYHEAEFARPNLDVHLPNLYRTESDLIAIFLCDEYKKKHWCNLEWRFIRQMISTADEDRIMFLSFDEVGAIPEIGILDGDGYVSIAARTPEEIAALIIQRLDPKSLWEPDESLVPVSEVQLAPSRLHHGADHLFGREDELAALDQVWNDPSKHVLTIVAFGGVGKTSLIFEWMARRAATNWLGFDRVFDWSFFSQGTRDQGAASADAFVVAALKFFGDERMSESAASPWDKGARLAHLVALQRTLLVLDGVEPLQHPPGPLAGELKDPALATLLKGLAQRNSGLCIVTTRERVADLGPFRDATAPEWMLQHLSTSAGVELLKTLGVRGTVAEFKQLVEDVKGHALTLNLLGRYLAKAHQGDIRKHDQVKFEKADAKTQGGYAFRTIGAYEKWLNEGGEDGARALAVLRLLGLFDRPADAGCIEALRREPAIAGLTEPIVGLNEDDWNLAVSSLADCGLVSVQADESTIRNSQSTIDAHPLIREYFAKQLREKNPEAWRGAHGRLFEHLTGTTDYQPDTLKGLQPLYQAVAHGCQAWLYDEAFKGVYIKRIHRDSQYYAWHNLGAFSTDLAALNWFFEQPWTRVMPRLQEEYQAWAFNQAAVCLKALGRLVEALEPSRAAAAWAQNQKKWIHAAAALSNLSGLELTFGLLSNAVDDAQQAFNCGEASDDSWSMMTSQTAFARALHAVGRRIDAQARFHEAEMRQAEDQPAYPLLYLGYGFGYCDLLLSECETAAWRSMIAFEFQAEDPRLADRCRAVEERASRTLEWASSRNAIGGIAVDQLTLGRAALYQSVLSSSAGSERVTGPLRPDLLLKAATHLPVAVDYLRRSSKQDEMPHGFLSRAWLRFLQNDPDSARSDLDAAWEIAGRGPMRLHMADIHLYRARLFHDVKPYPWTSPQADLAAARKLIEQCGYWRRKEELEDAEEAAKNW